MEKLTHSHGVAVQWHSYELRPAIARPISEEYRKKILAGRPRFEATAKAQYGLTINPGPFGIDTSRSHIGGKYAESQGVGPAYHEAVMAAYWKDAHDISDDDVLIDVAEGIGLERESFVAALDDPIYANEHRQDVQQAFQYGLNGVPASVLNNRYLVSGAQPYEAFVNVVEQVEAKERENG